MHLVFCLRAREKVKFVKVIKDGREKEEVVPMGLQAIQEKNFVFEMTLSLLLDEKTHEPEVVKCPEPLLTLFQSKQPLITKQMGVKLREWAEAAMPVGGIDPAQLFDQAMAYAEEGTASYQGFWRTLTSAQQKALLPQHEECKQAAAEADLRLTVEPTADDL